MKIPVAKIPEEMKSELTYGGRIRVNYKFYNYINEMKVRARSGHWLREYDEFWRKNDVDNSIRKIRDSDFSEVGGCQKGFVEFHVM